MSLETVFGETLSLKDGDKKSRLSEGKAAFPLRNNKASSNATAINFVLPVLRLALSEPQSNWHLPDRQLVSKNV